MNRDNIKAIGGIGPGSTNTRVALERRNQEKHIAKLRESRQRRDDNPHLKAYSGFVRHCGD